MMNNHDPLDGKKIKRRMWCLHSRILNEIPEGYEITTEIKRKGLPELRYRTMRKGEIKQC